VKRAAIRFAVSIGIKLVIAGAAFALEHYFKHQAEAKRAEEALPETAGPLCTCQGSPAFDEHVDEALNVVNVEPPKPPNYDRLAEQRSKHVVPDPPEYEPEGS
jgi:hypothetical protein